MAKILISPLGLGGRFNNKNNEQSERSYNPANYRIEGTEYPNSKFVSSVLYKHLELDGIIFIGTVKSMWEAVYEFFCEEKGVKKDDNYWYNLAVQIDSCNYQSNLDVIDLSPIKAILGKRSECILIKYGITEEELWQNFDCIIEVINSLQDGDQLYIDITHAFRSLAVLQFLGITFIQDLLINKKIKIEGIYYGMLEVARPTELGYAPIINLMPFFEMISWMQGAYTLKNFGNGYLISELLAQQNKNELSKSILHLSEAINLNYLPTIQQRATDLKTVLNSEEPSSPFKYLKHIPEDFVKQFSSRFSKQSDFQLKLAKWYFDNKHYATGYITLAESIITYVCEIYNKDFTNLNSRKEMKEILNKRENRQLLLSYLFNKINPIRNAIAHASFDKKRTEYLEAIKKAPEYHQKVKDVFKTGTLDNTHSI